QNECIRKYAGAGTWVLRGGLRRRPELRGHGVDLVSLGIESHSAGARLGLYVFRHAEFIGSILVDGGENAFTARGESKIGSGIEGGGIHAFADGQRGNQLAAVGIDDGHHFIVTAGEKAAAGAIQGEARRRFAGSEWPTRLDRELGGIEGEQFA